MGGYTVSKMEAPIQAPAPHPSRPRTRDSNDPKVVKHHLASLNYQQRMRAENPTVFLQEKREYNARHKEERNAKERARYARKRAELQAREPVPAI